MRDDRLQRLEVILADINNTDDDERQLAAIRLLPRAQREEALQLLLAVLRKRIDDHAAEVRALLADNPDLLHLFDEILTNFERSTATYRH